MEELTFFFKDFHGFSLKIVVVAGIWPYYPLPSLKEPFSELREPFSIIFKYVLDIIRLIS